MYVMKIMPAMIVHGCCVISDIVSLKWIICDFIKIRVRIKTYELDMNIISYVER